ncbi:hypothetical protein BDR05DRAFT_476959 [Suillus weaverae]|nr:hypothetical protein BDR05DRAFT_476959 [Suillus weaverae]
MHAGITYSCVHTNLAGDRYDNPGGWSDKLYRRSASDVVGAVLLGSGKYFALSRIEEYHSLRAGYRCHKHIVFCLPHARQRLVALFPFLLRKEALAKPEACRKSSD